MHAAEPTAKRRKQNRVSIKTGVRTRFFLLHFQYTQLYRKMNENLKNSPDVNPFKNNNAHLRRRYGYEEKRKV